ncbi:MAG: hypothetical protein BWK73_14390 [Thiothrix lacustris]|uniref:YbgF trimerisation domain-containing protein n=1 Tax=Thiothrix lacustris TaxID=525917 RepID=A0A1Y1QSB6_9GAMM|nr:MAG: hypothetical protein BWK73_14390 [Thiothrix lacustris]
MASLMLSVGGVMLYLTPAAQATEPPAAAPFSAPELTPEELAKLTPDERTRYDNLRESLQQVVQQLQALEQENTRLQQTITQGNANNQALDIEIDKLRPPQHVTPPTAP